MIFIVLFSIVYSFLSAIVAIIIKSLEHFRYTLRYILFEFRGANSDITARVLT